jgi:hypothetical protein
MSWKQWHFQNERNGNQIAVSLLSESFIRFGDYAKWAEKHRECYVKCPLLLNLTYLLNPWSRILLEKLIVSQPVKKFPLFYGTRRFIAVFASVRHLSPSWARSIQFMPSHPAS